MGSYEAMKLEVTKTKIVGIQRHRALGSSARSPGLEGNYCVTPIEATKMPNAQTEIKSSTLGYKFYLSVSKSAAVLSNMRT